MPHRKLKRWFWLSSEKDTERAWRDETQQDTKLWAKIVGSVCLCERWDAHGPPPREAAHVVYMARLVANYILDCLSLALRKEVDPENERTMRRVRGEAGNGETVYGSLCGMAARSLSCGASHAR